MWAAIDLNGPGDPKKLGPIKSASPEEKYKMRVEEAGLTETKEDERCEEKSNVVEDMATVGESSKEGREEKKGQEDACLVSDEDSQEESEVNEEQGEEEESEKVNLAEEINPVGME